MKINRTENATRNIAFGIVQKVYQIVLPFVLRTAMIYMMGVQYLGLNSLFTSVLQVLNLAELGVGNAMVYSMYRPIVEDDKATICSLMRLYRTYYRVIGLIIAAVGLGITPFIPMLVKSDLPSELNIYTLYLLNLASTVLTYWLFAYKNCLFQAHQRNDIVSKIALATDTVKYAIQLYVIVFVKDYYIYVIVMLGTQILNNIIAAIIATKMYPEYMPKGELDRDVRRDINHRIRDLFTSKVGGVILNSADTIVISAFLGLTVLAIYQNYYYILTSVIGFLTIIFQSCMAGIGNSVITETSEKNYRDLRKFTLIVTWIAGMCACCFLCMFQPFMKIWVGEELMMEFTAVICFCIYFFVYEVNQLLNLYKDAAGIWHEDRFRPLVTSCVNLGLNLITVQFWGVYGVIFSTVIATLFVGMPWLMHNLFSVLFERRMQPGYLKMLARNVLIVLVSCVVCFGICRFITFTPWVTLILRAAVCCILPNLVYLFVYRRTTEFGECVRLLDKITHGRFKFINRLAG